MKKRFLINTIITILGLIGLMAVTRCGSSTAVDERLSVAEQLMEERPDSSLYILNGIDVAELRGRRSKARYALLKSMALDKNYIDTTTFDILQPAIDYYLKNGNPNDKLRTYYYKGRIHRNAGADDLAMQSYLSGLEISEDISDSLTLTRLLVAQATLFYKQYRISEFIENNIKAGDLYGKLGKSMLQFKCYCKALDGECRLMNKLAADSLANICQKMINDGSIVDKQVWSSLLIYIVSFGNKKEINNIIEELEKVEITNDAKMTLAQAYKKIGEGDKGLLCLNEVIIASNDILDSLTYWSIKTEILENMGEDKRALDAFRNYSRVLEIYHDQLFSNELLFSEKKHEMELESMGKIHRRDNTIKWILGGVAVLICVIGLIYYRYRLNKAARLIAEQNAEKLQLRNENLQLETEKLQLETEKLQLEADNLRLEVGQLEEERERLSGLLDQRDTLSEEARQLIRERIDMLNGLLAKAITNEDKYAKEFQKYVEKIKKDKKKFQQSIGKVMKATHPDFMKYLEAHGLTEREIDYVCLYAIGLRGKEIGNYLDLARHYNMSTDIRKKLGLDTNDSNLGPFIRKMMTGEKDS